MKTKKFMIVLLVILIGVSLVVITGLFATSKNEYFQILPDITITKEELSFIKTGEIKKIVDEVPVTFVVYNGYEENADYSNMSPDEIAKSDLATQKNRISIHYDDGIIFDIIAAKFDSKEILDKAFDWYRCGAYQVCLDPEDLAERRIGDRSARKISPTGADIIVAYKGCLFKIGCIHPPASELSTKDMNLAENLTKLILEKVDGIK